MQPQLRRLWTYRVLALLITAVAVHLLAVWATPRLIMWVVMRNGIAETSNRPNLAGFLPAITSASRDVVMPSPDMLYGFCVFDVSGGPVQVTADPRLKSYWSIALYGANSDNFFVINDRKAGDATVNLWLVSEGANRAAPPIPPGSQVVVTPSGKGLLLMRVLTADYDAEKSLLEPARRTLSCKKV